MLLMLLMLLLLRMLQLMSVVLLIVLLLVPMLLAGLGSGGFGERVELAAFTAEVLLERTLRARLGGVVPAWTVVRSTGRDRLLFDDPLRESAYWTRAVESSCERTQIGQVYVGNKQK